MIIALNPYPDYRGFGVEWLGDMPAHWEVRRMKRIASLNPSKAEARTFLGADTPVTFLPMERVKTDGRIDEEILPASTVWNGFTYFRRNDVLVAKITPCFENGKGTCLNALPTEVGFGSTEFHVLRAGHDISPRFLYLLTTLPDFRQSGADEMTGAAGQQRVPQAFVENYSLPLPPLTEQAAIVRYLDHADGRIRRYISAKERLIGLLEKQRQAVIHRAVTRGLDSDVHLKPSGIECLGKLPAHWDVQRLRHAVNMRVSNVDKHIKDGERPVRLCNYVDVYKNDRITDSVPFMKATANADEIDRFRLEPEDILITKDSEVWNDIGVPALVEYSAKDLICGYHLALLRPLKAVLNGAYLFRSLQSSAVAYQFHIAANGVIRYGLSHHAIKSALLPLPLLAEQANIVRYLDHANGRIRRYISAKERLIGLLEEQRQDVIYRAVTRGLDPDVHLKPSGIECLGEVPAHWDVRQLRYAVNMRVSNVDKHIKDGERPVRLCNYVDVYKNDRITDSVPFMKATANANEIDRFRLEPEDILITKDSEVWNDIGVPALVEYSAKDLICGYHLALLRPLKAVLNGAYLFRSLQSSAIAYQFHIAANGVTRYRLSHHAIKSALLPIPPLAEQAAIVKYLDKATADVDADIARARRHIELLREYRTRLIADVVTGKFDVREVATTLSEKTDESNRLGETDECSELEIAHDHKD